MSLRTRLVAEIRRAGNRAAFQSRLDFVAKSALLRIQQIIQPIVQVTTVGKLRWEDNKLRWEDNKLRWEDTIVG